MRSLRNKLNHAAAPGARRRRGVAMLLVLVAMSVGMVLAASMLSSRDNSPAIGAHARDFAAATWSAQAGAEFAMAVMQTNVDWLDLTGGDLLTGFQIAGGDASVTVTNLAGLPPTDADRELILTVVATVGDMRSTVQRRLSIVPPGPLGGSISPYLDEFAAFATSQLDVQDSASIGPTRHSPEADSLYPIKIGAGFSSLGDLSLGASVQASRVSLYVDANASVALRNGVNSNPNLGAGGTIPLRVPAYPVTLPPEITSLPLRNLGAPVVVADLGGAPGLPDTTLASGGRYGDIEISTNGILRVQESAGEFYEFKSLTIREGGTLQISGKVSIHVKGALELRAGSTVDLIAEDSAARFLTSDDVNIADATFGLGGAFASLPRSSSEISEFLNPARFRILSVDPASGAKGSPTITLSHNAAVLGCIHTPNATVELKDDSFVIGRITARSLHVRSGSAIVYEPLLDSRAGYTALYGPMYEHGAPLPDVVTTIASYTAGEGAESIHARIVSKAAQKWNAQPSDAWFADVDLHTNLDPFVGVILEDATEDIGKLAGGLLGGGSTSAPPAPAPAPPTSPNKRFAGKVCSAPMTLAVRQLED